MGKRSMKALAYDRFRLSGPGWDTIVVPVGGSTDSAVVMSRIDPYTGRQVYGQVLARYAHKKAAEKLAAELNTRKAELLTKAFP